MPLLQETHYDRWSSMASKFEFEMLYAKAVTALEQST